MTKRRVLILFVLMLLSACAPSQSTGSSASWAYPFVKWEGHIYVITDETVPLSKIGRSIGEVTSYSDIEGSETEDNFSNAYKKGTKYYKIKNSSTEKQIAVKKDKDTFIKAVEESVWRQTK